MTKLKGVNMNVPQRYGTMYIKFDDNNVPEYAFEFQGNKIKRFFPLTDKEINYIVLPKINRATELSAYIVEGIDEKDPTLYEKKSQLQNYVHGDIKICEGCFQGLKKATIIVPFVNYVMLDWGSFDKEAEIKFILPKSSALKEICRHFDAGYNFERWTLIGDKRISGQLCFSSHSCFGERYGIYNHRADLTPRIANFKVSHTI